MSRRFSAFTAAVVLLLATAFGGAQAPPAAQVAGTVVDGTSGDVIGGVVVAITGRGLPQPRRVVTDPRGRFVFETLPAGVFSLQASRPGYFGGGAGQQESTGPPHPVDVAAAARVADLTLRLWKLGAIEGTVAGDANEPLAGVDMHALRRTLVDGRPRLVDSGVGGTDDRGRYRLNLPPGDYAITARPPRTRDVALLLATLSANPAVAADIMTSATMSGRGDPELDARVRDYAMAVLQAAAPARATFISVGPETERTGIDFHLKSVPVVRVSGMVAGTGTPDAGLTVRLIPADGWSEMESTPIDAGIATCDDEGRFAFSGVTPGRYLAVVSTNSIPAGEPVSGARVPITVGTADLAGVTIPARTGLAVSGQPNVESGTRRQRATGATVSGVVFLDDAARRPARDALVMIAGIDVGLIRATTTDDAGRFSLGGIPPGRFVVSAGKSRYSAAMYGASWPGRPGIVIAIRAAEAIKDVRLELARGAVITGHVVDEEGHPLPGTRVRVLGHRAVGGDVALIGDAGEPTTITTDDRGAYRVFGLAPGNYVVGVQPRGIAPLANGTAIGYGPTYYSATPLAERASMITLSAGEERSNIDIRMTLARFGRIDGTIAGMDRVAPQHQITLRPRGLNVSGTVLYAQNVRATPDGRFSFTNVPPGDYTILARTLPPPNAGPPGVPPPPPPPPSWALADVSVNGSDVSGVSLTWQPGLTVDGRVQFEGQAQLPPDRLGLRSTPASNVPGPPDQVSVDASGRFTLTGLLPGKYWLTTTLPANPVTQIADWFAKSAMVDGADALDLAFEIRAGGSPEVLLTLTDHAQQIDGTVRTAAGQGVGDCPVVVFPVDQQLWFPQSRRIVVRRSNEAGEWLFGLASALPTGEYYVAAAPGLATGEQFDPSLLADLAKTAARVNLGPNDSKTVAIVVSRK